MWALATGGIVYVSFLLSSSVASCNAYYLVGLTMSTFNLHTYLFIASNTFSLEQQKFKFSIYPKEEQDNLKSVHQNTHLTLFISVVITITILYSFEPSEKSENK